MIKDSEYISLSEMYVPYIDGTGWFLMFWIWKKIRVFARTEKLLAEKIQVQDRLHI